MIARRATVPILRLCSFILAWCLRLLGLKQLPPFESSLPCDIRAACANGDCDAVEVWLKAGGNVNARHSAAPGVSMLMVAAVHGHIELAKFLLRHGADVDLQSRDPPAYVALFPASLEGHTAMVRLLLEAGADASSVLRHLAAEGDDASEAIRRLLSEAAGRAKKAAAEKAEAAKQAAAAERAAAAEQAAAAERVAEAAAEKAARALLAEEAAAQEKAVRAAARREARKEARAAKRAVAIAATLGVETCRANVTADYDGSDGDGGGNDGGGDDDESAAGDVPADVAGDLPAGVLVDAGQLTHSHSHADTAVDDVHQRSGSQRQPPSGRHTHDHNERSNSPCCTFEDAKRARNVALPQHNCDPVWVGLSEIREVTDGFSSTSLIGSGAFGSVFRSQPLPSFPSAGPCAIKRLSHVRRDVEPAAAQTALRLLHAEARHRCMCHHPRLLPLLATCAHEVAPCLVFPLMLGGNLEDRLLRTADSQRRLSALGHAVPPPPLTWRQRLGVLHDIVSALVYLHSDMPCKPPIVHRRLSPQNVLLDERAPTACGLLPEESLNSPGGANQPSGSKVIIAYLADAGVPPVWAPPGCVAGRRGDDGTGGGMSGGMSGGVSGGVCNVSNGNGGGSGGGVGCGPCCGAPGFIDPLLADGRSPNTLSDGFAVGAIVLMTLTGQPGIDLVSRCGGMLGHPEEPGRWRSPGVPDMSAGDWPEQVARGLAGIAAGLVADDPEQRMALPETLRRLEAMLLLEAEDKEDWFVGLRRLWFSEC